MAKDRTCSVRVNPKRSRASPRALAKAAICTARTSRPSRAQRKIFRDANTAARGRCLRGNTESRAAPSADGKVAQASGLRDHEKGKPEACATLFRPCAVCDRSERELRGMDHHMFDALPLPRVRDVNEPI